MSEDLDIEFLSSLTALTDEEAEPLLAQWAQLRANSDVALMHPVARKALAFAGGVLDGTFAGALKDKAKGAIDSAVFALTDGEYGMPYSAGKAKSRAMGQALNREEPNASLGGLGTGIVGSIAVPFGLYAKLAQGQKVGAAERAAAVALSGPFSTVSPAAGRLANAGKLGAAGVADAATYQALAADNLHDIANNPTALAHIFVQGGMGAVTGGMFPRR